MQATDDAQLRAPMASAEGSHVVACQGAAASHNLPDAEPSVQLSSKPKVGGHLRHRASTGLVHASWACAKAAWSASWSLQTLLTRLGSDLVKEGRQVVQLLPQPIAPQWWAGPEAVPTWT